jgi:magnesium-transporting ATPase (P-type)
VSRRVCVGGGGLCGARGRPPQHRHPPTPPREHSATTKGVPLDANSTLLRGCVLKNVKFVYGFVVYTGRETKVRVKQSSVITKKASVENEINRYIVALIALQVVLCIVGAVGTFVWSNRYNEGSWYLQAAAPTGADAVIRFFTFFLLISNIIPISLYVSMKLARTAQKIFMDNDAHLLYVDTELAAKTNGEEGSFPLKVRSMDLNDELGQISHIFSDKTGTLTSNYMEFRKLTVNGVVYGRGTTEIGMARRRRLGMDVSDLQRLMDDNKRKPREIPHVNYIEGSESHPGRVLRGPGSDMNGTGAARDPAQAQAIRLFFLNLCLNHTVVLETVTDRHTGKERQQLSASSPDEEAFVLASQLFGYRFVNRAKDMVTLEVRRNPASTEVTTETFRIVVILPYSSVSARRHSGGGGRGCAGGGCIPVAGLCGDHDPPPSPPPGCVCRPAR